MMRLFTFVFVLLGSIAATAQSKTTEKLHKQYAEAFNLFFYNNTLRMLNQQESKEFDELIKDIEKLKFLAIDKKKSTYTSEQHKQLIKGYQDEEFEEIMTSRHQGKTFDVFLKEKNGVTKGMIVLVNDEDNLLVLDILGRIALEKVTSLYDVLGETTEVGGNLKKFLTGDEEKKVIKEDKKQ